MIELNWFSLQLGQLNWRKRTYDQNPHEGMKEILRSYWLLERAKQAFSALLTARSLFTIFLTMKKLAKSLEITPTWGFPKRYLCERQYKFNCHKSAS